MEGLVSAEMRHQGDYSNHEAIRRKGCLQLAVYVNYGMLTVHVMKGRNLQSEVNTKCNSVVKLCLVPDEENITSCRTQVNMDSNSPNYDEKFSFEVVDQDAHRRLLIAVWHIEDDQSTSEFLGCMSFGLKHIVRQKKTIHGWYHLLEQETGQRKHLHVTSAPRQPKLMQPPPPQTTQPPPPPPPYHPAQHPPPPFHPAHQPPPPFHPAQHPPPPFQVRRQPLQSINANVMDMDDDSTENEENVWTDCMQIVVKRGLGGYGFSISGCRPVEVCNIDPLSSAEYAGLRVKDQIMSINGISIMDASTQDVAMMVRHRHSHCLILEIQRPYRSADLHNLSTLSTKTCISSATASMSSYAAVRPLHQTRQRHEKQKSRLTVPVLSSTPTKEMIARQSSFSFFKRPHAPTLKRQDSNTSIANSVGSVSMTSLGGEQRSKKQKLKSFANNILHLGRYR